MVDPGQDPTGHRPPPSHHPAVAWCRDRLHDAVGAGRRLTGTIAAGLPGRAGQPHQLDPQTRLSVLTVLGAAALSLSMVVAASASSSPQSSASRWVASVAGAPAPTATPPPPHQPLQPLAVRPQRSPVAELPPPPPPEREDDDGVFVTWAMMNLHTGTITGSDTLAATSTTASMIKVWLVADYLRMTDDPSARLPQLSTIVRDSHNDYAQDLFEDLGKEASIHRLIDICGLTDSHAIPGYWSNTRLSGRDTARMGACLADGRGAGPEWTGWLLNEMRQVRGVGDFGIRHALPAGQRGSVAIKNGWVIRTEANEWHVNCLAIGDGWSMGVLTRYPADLGYAEGGHRQGAEICRSLAAEHLPG